MRKSAHAAAVKPAPLPSIDCSVSPAQAAGQGAQGVGQGAGQGPLTVGAIRQLQCKIAGTSLTSQSQVQFSYENKESPYDIAFLGQPRVQNDFLVQEITSYKTGSHDFKDVTVKIDGKTFLASPFHLDVQSVLPPQSAPAGPGQEAQQGPTPYPLVDPMSVPAPWWWWALWAALVVLIVGYAVRKILKFKKARAVQTTEGVKELTPQEKFQARLRKLESQGLHLKGDFKKFALELTNIVKTAIGTQFRFPAEDQTTEEVLTVLQKKEKIFFNAAGNSLQSLLNDLDQIKFAKTQTTPQACEFLLDHAARVGRALFGGGS